MADIKLSNGQCSLEVKLCGGQVSSFKGPDGREVMWNADPAVWAQHSPLLFPVCGSVPPEGIKIGGVLYPMVKHGFTRNAPFQVSRLGDDFVELVLRPNEDTRKVYPFDFALYVTYTLVDNGYTTTFTVENNSDKVMPFCVGGHPGFAVPMEDGAAFSDYQVVFECVEEGKNSLAPGGGRIDGYEYLDCFHNSDTLPLSYDLFDEKDALIFADLKSRSVKLVHKDTGKGLRFDFPKIEVLAIWTKPGAHAPYVCLEPWHGMPGLVDESGNFEDKPFVTMLEPGKCWQCGFTATLI